MNLNNKNTDNEIKLIDGYELTKSIRIYKNYMINKEGKNEAR